MLKVGGNEEVEVDTQEPSQSTVAGVERDSLGALNIDMDICSLKTGIQYPLCAECSMEVEKEMTSQIHQVESRTEAFEMLRSRYRDEHADDEEHLLRKEKELDGKIAEIKSLLESER